jgi:hypothetical protein
MPSCFCVFRYFISLSRDSSFFLTRWMALSTLLVVICR